MTSNKILIIGYFIFFSSNILGQRDPNNNFKPTVQITLEEQSYLEKSFHNSQYHDVEKSAGLSTAFNLMIQKGHQLDQRFSVNYGFGIRFINQKYDFTETYSSDWNFLEMGSSNVRSLYLSLASKIFYKKLNTKSFYFSPFVGLGLNGLVTKNEELIQNKSGYSSMINPDFTFNRFVPEVSLGFMCFYNPKNLNYGFALGPSINNNAKYFHEPVGILSFPVSISINLSIIRNHLVTQ